MSSPKEKTMIDVFEAVSEDNSAYWSGRDVGKSVSIDPQAESRNNKRIAG